MFHSKFYDFSAAVWHLMLCIRRVGVLVRFTCKHLLPSALFLTQLVLSVFILVLSLSSCWKIMQHIQK